MASRRSERRARTASPEWAEASPVRQALSQRAGEVLREGDPAAAKVLEGALRHRERIERATHGFHSYPAGLHPDAAAELLTLGEGPVLDPFCGGGTVLVEALIAGRPALGCDINPVATLVARARTTLTDEAGRTALRSLSRKAAEAGRYAGLTSHHHGGRDILNLQDRVPPMLLEWYDPWTIAELDAIRTAIGNDMLARAVFSSILVKTSYRESDTSNRKVPGTRPPGTAATLFHKRAREFARQLEALEAAVKLHPADPDLRARAHREDAREIREKDFGMVVTSPPYPGVYDYVPLQQLRLAWLNLDPGNAPRDEIGSRRSFRADRATAVAAWRDDTLKWMKAASRSLRPGGRLVVIVGDGVVADRPVDAIGAIGEAARLENLTRVARATVERWDEGVGRMRPEHAVLYERAGG